MEHKVEQLLLKGLSILFEYKEPFLKEWKKLVSSANIQHTTLASEFDSMIQLAIHQVSKQETPSVDTIILSLLDEWQNRFSTIHDEYESIFLLTSIENLFHKLLVKNPMAAEIDHQAIQAFFSRILDHALLTHDLQDRTEKWLKMILATKVIPIKWIALVRKVDQDFQISKVVCSSKFSVETHLLEICSNLKSKEINHLSNALSRLIDSNSPEASILQISCFNETLLLCLQEKDFPVTHHQTEFIKGMYLRQLKLHHLESKLEWKDASLLFLQSLLKSRSVNRAVQAITKGLTDFMPFKRCALFLYNHHEEKGIGVCGYNVNNSSLQQIRETIFKLPLIKKHLNSLNYSQPLYFSNALEVLPKRYVREFRLKSFVVLPILAATEGNLLGIAILDQGEDSQFEVSTPTLTTLIKFGQYAGESLHSIWDEALQQYGSSNSVLTTREKEVLKLIAEGASINEAAQELHLSSYTVRDYVSIIIQKLAAKNRTDAAVKAIKMKLIS
ncbi:response regulator transcription factor [Neobacillus cucumis]|uniref:response regulator transcription factor n=1 Tax=Neobacillus cucumis TaxID=1740721 RepID=UPI0018DFFAE1|nr:LuxR C-terminal-related transcriptional regulator [Neobacillus cucumis]MBI0578911.1 response regulator transcription factor [Neobacillus cucumis]